MAIKLDVRYPGRATAANTDYPQGSFKDRSAPGVLDGSYLEKDWANDQLAVFQAALRDAGLTPNGVVDTSVASQYYTAFKAMFSQGGLVGDVRNARMSVTAASATATYTADQVNIMSALNGALFRVTSFNKTINLATTGAGGMDAGSAPVSGYVGLYAIYNPTTGASALLGVNAATLLPMVYGGANMPAGYTASALIGAYATNGSGQILPAYQVDRNIYFPAKSVLSTSTPVVWTNISIAGAVPANAKSIGGTIAASAGANGTVELDIAGSASGIGQVTVGVLTNTVSVPAGAAPFSSVPLITPQQLSYQLLIANGPVAANILISSYTV